jgi:hypothetical protein
MATVKIADVIVPAVFNPYVIERTADRANFYLGGIVSNNPELNVLAQSGGKLVNMPFWEDLSGDDEVLSDTTPLTPAKIQAKQDVAALLMRGKAWQANDLAKALSGSDPMGAVADLVADYWARKYRDVAVKSLQGVIAHNVAGTGDMVSDISAALDADVTSDTKFSVDAFINGQSTFGDAAGGLVGIAMHPDVYFNMLRLDKTSFERDSMGDATVETYRGMRVIVDRNLPYTPKDGANAAKYTTFLFGDGAFGLGQGAAPVPTETDRDSLAGNDILVTRTHFLMHPRGVKFTNASVAGASPTNAELATAANWSRVYERENVRIAAIVTNG